MAIKQLPNRCPTVAAIGGSIPNARIIGCAPARALPGKNRITVICMIMPG